MSINEAVARLNSLQLDIRNVNPLEAPSDTLKTNVLFAGLGSHYWTIITILSGDANLTFTAAVSRFRDEELKRSNRIKDPAGGLNLGRGDSALYTKSSTTKKPGTCNNCGKKGHWAKECRSKKKNSEHGKKSSNGSGQDSNREDCQGATNHMTADRRIFVTYRQISPVDIHLAND
ncbi:MAG: hypothetical protein M1826_005121 [Phylliscum demangeonii]|nr:MAG: hypothetical protein M1826_005121 [Phylliscum demangeonii]